VTPVELYISPAWYIMPNTSGVREEMRLRSLSKLSGPGSPNICSISRNDVSCPAASSASLTASAQWLCPSPVEQLRRSIFMPKPS